MQKRDITRHVKEQDPPQHWRLGVAQVTSWLYLGGQEDVCQILPEVDVWIDFRHELPTNRTIYLPDHVIYHRMAFVDGNLEELRAIYPKAKRILDEARQNKQKALVSCHAGVSRSAVLALWCLAEEMGSYDEAYQKLFKARPYFEPHVKFQPFLEELQQMYGR